MKFILLGIRFYQFFVKPVVSQNCCRFEPSCSHYMVEALEKYGMVKGIWVGFKRILRCHPWGGSGPDPVQ